MLPEGFSSDDPEEWLNRARSNLIQARESKPGVYLEDLCFQAQQAAEKAFKALLLRYDTYFPRVHDLARLITLLEHHGESVPGQIREVARLSAYAVEARYPGISEPVSSPARKARPRNHRPAAIQLARRQAGYAAPGVRV